MVVVAAGRVKYATKTQKCVLQNNFHGILPGGETNSNRREGQRGRLATGPEIGLANTLLEHQSGGGVVAVVDC